MGEQQEKLMGTPGSGIPLQRLLEDPLAQLPCSTIAEYRKGQIVYAPEQPSASIYLVIDGKVKVCRPAPGGLQVVVDIYKSDEFFGEVAFLGLPQSHELAAAIENTTVMMWTAAEIEEIVSRRPKLGIALLQFLVQRSMDFVSRIETFAVDNIARRLARALLRFSERFGNHTDDGSVQMIPFTHELLAQYVGTSREIVTHYMNQFRREGYLEYSRQGILLRGDALRAWLGHSASQSTSAAA
jgi:CRP/FNR family cyclic AMP-dependent transcriptional regulator